MLLPKRALVPVLPDEAESCVSLISLCRLLITASASRPVPAPASQVSGFFAVRSAGRYGDVLFDHIEKANCEFAISHLKPAVETRYRDSR
ncbi:hypothetical protein ACUNV4_04030 [Granulosicoccus sp. 3-233]